MLKNCPYKSAHSDDRLHPGYRYLLIHHEAFTSETIEKIQTIPLIEQAVSVVTMAELLYGAKLSSKPKLAIEAYDAFIKYLAVHDWTQEAAEHYADIRADLKRRGEMIGANDLLIAAHARSAKAVLVTNNVREFGRVKGLKVENWAK